MKDNHIIRIGDTVYQDSKSYHKVFEWKILDIWFEDYISGVKTIVKCSNGSWTEEFFASDIAYMHRSREDAERALRKEGEGK